MHTDEIIVEDLAYQDGETQLLGVLVAPRGTGGQRPGVLLVPAAFGIVEHARERARMVAELGYVVLVADHFGEGRGFSTIEEAMGHVGPLAGNIDGWRTRLGAALSALRNHPDVDADRIAAIGFCFGGTGVLELAFAGEDLKAVISFHGGLKLSETADGTNVKASILVCTGANDPLVPDTDMAEFQRRMHSGTADWQVHIYGNTLHAFTDPAIDGLNLPVARYDVRADQRSWRAMEALFAETLQG